MKKIKFLSISIVLVIAFLIGLIFYNNSSQDEYKLNKPSDVAVFVYDETKNDYVKQKEIPTGYVLNTSKSYCKSGSEIVNYKNNVGLVNYSLKNDDQCYLYFDTYLPKGYTKLDYIEGTGTQYIDTGVSAPNGFQAEMKFSINELVSSYIIGAHELSNPYGRNGFGLSGANAELGTGDTFPQWTQFSTNTLYTAKISTEKGASYAFVNGNQIISTTDSTYRSDDNLLLGFNQYGIAYGGVAFKGKIYYMKIYIDGALVRDLVPCKNPQGEVGMYDLVGKRFYNNVGSGSFGYDYDTNWLPAGYTALSYIEGTGTQYIDTGYYWRSENTEVYFDGVILQNAHDESLFGNEEYIDSGGSRYFAGVLYGWNGAYTVYTGNGSYISTTIPSNTRFNLKITTNASKQVSLYKDGNLLNTATYSGSVLTKNNAYLTSSSSTNVGSIFLLANHNSSMGASNSGTQIMKSARVYSFKLKDNGTVVRSLVPCINANGEVGMYDQVEGKFYRNVGTGNFKYEYASDGLPSGYTLLKYIQTTGSQWINTGVYATNKTNVELDGEFISGQSNSWIPMLGQRITSGSNMYAIWINSSSYAVAINLASTDTGTIANTNGLGRHLYAIKNSSLYLDSMLKKENINVSAFSSSGPVYLFGLNNGSTSEQRSINAKVYSLKFWEGNTLIRDFKPCMDSNGTIGLYDFVNREFYTNSGTGTFGYLQ